MMPSARVARALDSIGDWWSLLIIRDAFDGLCRFGEFEKSLGVAKNILTVRLRKLVSDGILKTAPAGDGSRHQDYLLTEKDSPFFMSSWGYGNGPKNILLEKARRIPS